MMPSKNPPYFFERRAIEAEDQTRWGDAADNWLMAKARSLGHNRRARYEECQKECEAKAGRHANFLKEE